MRSLQASSIKVTAPSLFLLMVFILMVMACSQDDPIGTDDGALKEWTFLLYDDADFYRSYNPLNDFGKRVWSGAKVNILVLTDDENDPAVLGYIDSEHLPVKLKDMGEVNMGDPATLLDFLTYAREYYPAERYIISFYDHGGGWRGTCWDETNGHDNLTMHEIQEAFSAFGGIDLVLFSAPCLMGSVEAAYELRNCTEVYIGSENLSGYRLWTETMGDICQTLHSSPGITNIGLGELIIDSIQKHANDPEPIPTMTMSAVRTDRLTALAEVVDTVSLAYLDRVEAFRTQIDSVIEDITVFSPAYVDLFDMASELLDVEDSSQIRSALLLMQQRLEESIIAECHGSAWPDAHGLSIFLPTSTMVSNGILLTYTSTFYNLDFVKDTHWDELWEALYSSDAARTGNNIPINPLLLPNGYDILPVNSRRQH